MYHKISPIICDTLPANPDTHLWPCTDDSNGQEASSGHVTQGQSRQCTTHSPPAACVRPLTMLHSPAAVMSSRHSSQNDPTARQVCNADKQPMLLLMCLHKVCPAEAVQSAMPVLIMLQLLKSQIRLTSAEPSAQQLVNSKCGTECSLLPASSMAHNSYSLCAR